MKTKPIPTPSASLTLPLRIPRPGTTLTLPKQAEGKVSKQTSRKAPKPSSTTSEQSKAKVSKQTGKKTSKKVPKPYVYRPCKVYEEPVEPFPFLNFPWEIRQLVYRFLLAPALTVLEEFAYFTTGHTCLQPTSKVNCECARRHIRTNILSTCKAVYKEAMPVLYNNMELRLAMPNNPKDIDPTMQHTLSRLPAHAFPLIRRVLLVGKIPEILRFNSWYSAGQKTAAAMRLTALQRFCIVLEQKLQNLRHVRLVLTTDPFASFSSLRNVDMKLSARLLESFRLLAVLPGLKTVKIKFKEGQAEAKVLWDVKEAIEKAVVERGVQVRVYESDGIGRVI